MIVAKGHMGRRVIWENTGPACLTNERSFYASGNELNLQ